MAKYISSIRDLVILAMTNSSEIEAEVKNNNAEACFQMGMIHLLGILSPINFKKAAFCFGNQSLADDSDANRLLGFIAECEKKYSESFRYYANVIGTPDKDKQSYTTVSEERNNLQKFFKKMELPTNIMNAEVSDILGKYIKGGKSKIEASLKIATICSDEQSCLEAAQTLYDIGEFYSAKRWLQKGNIPNDNLLYNAIENKLANSKKMVSLPAIPQVSDIQGCSILFKFKALNDIADIKHKCEDASAVCEKQWLKESSNLIYKIRKQLEKEEYQAFLQEQAEKEERAKIYWKIFTIAIVALCGFIWGILAEGTLVGGYLCTGILLFVYFSFKILLKFISR